MSKSFPHTHQSLALDGSRRTLTALVVVLLFLILWTTWAVAARVTVYSTTAQARIEVDREKHPVDAPISGRVVTVRAIVGQHVREGDVLVILDATSDRLARDQQAARVSPTRAQIASLRAEMTAQERAGIDEGRSGRAAIDEATAKSRQATAAASFAADEASRLATLRAQGLVSELDALRARNVATERDGDARAAEFAAQRAQRELDVRQHDRQARLASLQREVGELEEHRGDATTATARLDYSIDQHTVRAPVDGVIAEVTPLKSGGMVSPGQRLATVVPSGALKVVALFAPADALGRVRRGQHARVRLDAFPWTQYGNVDARVTSVAGEPSDGRIRVELALSPGQNPAIVFQHGLAAAIDIAVEKVSPARLVMRSIGADLRVAAAATP